MEWNGTRGKSRLPSATLRSTELLWTVSLKMKVFLLSMVVKQMGIAQMLSQVPCQCLPTSTFVNICCRRLDGRNGRSSKRGEMSWKGSSTRAIRIRLGKGGEIFCFVLFLSCFIFTLFFIVSASPLISVFTLSTFFLVQFELSGSLLHLKDVWRRNNTWKSSPNLFS